MADQAAAIDVALRLADRSWVGRPVGRISLTRDAVESLTQAAPNGATWAFTPVIDSETGDVVELVLEPRRP